MLIDIILDRRDGAEYKASRLFAYLLEDGEVFPFYRDIARVMDEGMEEDVKETLCRYVTEHGYRRELCDYVRSVKWL